MSDKDLLAGFQLPTTAPKYQATGLVDKILGGEDTVPGGMPTMGRLPVPKYQPVNKATMECLRGPCRHLWTLTARQGDFNIGDDIQLKRIRQCNCHYEPTELAEENIFECSEWWPSTLQWVPISLRSVLRPRLRQMWERWLKHDGYDFSWRTWPDDIFEADDAERRKNAKPGAPSGAGLRKKKDDDGRHVDGGMEYGG